MKGNFWLVILCVLWVSDSVVDSRGRAEDQQPLRYRRIFLPFGQEPRLVPPNYTPLKLNDLQAEIERRKAPETVNSATLVEASYLVWFNSANRSLTCDSGTLAYVNQGEFPVRVSLGNTNVAVHPAAVGEEMTAEPNRLWFLPTGEMVARLSTEKSLSWQWSATGQRSLDGSLLFDLRLPVAQRSVMWLRLPEGLDLVSSAAPIQVVDVLPAEVDQTQLSHPPESTHSRWWRVDFGGMGNIQLKILNEPDLQNPTVSVVRRASIEYDVQPLGLSWIARYSIDYGGDRQLPSFGLSGNGRVTSVTIDAEPVQWSEVRQGDRLVLELEPVRSTALADSRLATITLIGVAPVELLEPQMLPWVRPVRTRLVAVDPNVQIQLSVDKLVAWPKTDTLGPWQLQTRSAESVRWQWIGPHQIAPPSIEFANVDQVLRGASLTGVTVERGRLQARWTSLLELPNKQPRLIRLRCSPGWDIESVTGPQGSVSRADANNSRLYQLWLEPDEINATSQVKIQVIASRPLGVNTQANVSIPPGSIAEIDEARLDEAVFVQAPVDREVQISIDGRRRQVSNLESLNITANLMAEIPVGGLMFSGAGGIPAIDLRPRLPAFDVDVRTRLTSATNERLQWETDFDCTPRGGELSEVKLRLQPANATDISWQLELGDNDIRTVVTADREDTEQYTDWTIRLGAARGTPFKLIGRLLLKENQRVPLASVLGAANQRTEVQIASDLRISSLSDDLAFLPLPAGSRDTARIRYNLDEQASLSVVHESEQAVPSLVCWKWIVVNELGDSGNVTIACEARLSGTGPFRLNIPAGVRLVSAQMEKMELRPEQRTLSATEFSTNIDSPSPVTLTIQFVKEGNGQSIWMYEPQQLKPAMTPAFSETRTDVSADVWTYPLSGTETFRVLVVRSATGIVLGLSLSFVLFVLGWSCCGQPLEWLVSAFILILAALALVTLPPLRQLCIVMAFSLALGRALHKTYLKYLKNRAQHHLATSSRSLLRKGSTRSIAKPASGVSLLMLLAYGVFAAIASLGFSQESGKNPIHDIVILVDDQGKPVGDVVYVPEALNKQLKSSAQSMPSTPVFLSADYSLNLIRSNALSSGEGVSLEARWTILVEDDQEELLLPISADFVQYMEFNKSGISRFWRKAPEGVPPGVLIQPPNSGILQLRATLLTDVLFKADSATLSVTIPQVASSQLKVLYDVSASPPEILGSVGPVEVNTPARELNAQLGASNKVQVRWRVTPVVPLVSEQLTEPRWWLHFGTDGVSAELEYDRPVSSVPLRLLVDQNLMPLSTNAQWHIRSSELLEGNRLQLQINPLSDAPGPLRLLWQLPFAVATDTSVRIPTIQFADERAASSAIVGIDAPAGWQVVPKGDAVESLPTESLMAKWKGRRGTLNAVYHLEKDAIPSFGVTVPATPVSEARAFHRLHVIAPSELRLRYQLDLTHSESELLRLELPNNLTIDRFEVDGLANDQVPSVVNKQRTLVVLPGNLPSARRVVLVGRLPRSARIRPPHIRVANREVNESIYEVVHDPGIRVALEGEETLARLPFELTTGQQLADMLIPFRRWQLDPRGQKSLSLTNWLTIEGRPFQGNANLLTTVRWNDGLWTGETLLVAERDGGTTNFLSLEVPAGWSDSITIEPSAAMAVLPPENGIRLVHILPTTSNDKEPLRYLIRYQFSTSSSRGRVDAPIVRLLGRGKRQYRFVLPGKLTNQSVEWQRSGMRVVNTTPEKLGIAAAPAEPIVLEPEAPERPFSATPIISDRRESNRPQVSLREAWVIPGANQTNAHIRWDYYPGASKATKIDLPAGTQVISAMSCGRPANFRVDNDQVTIDLHLHQMSQPLELVVALRDPTNVQLPAIRDVDVAQSLVHFLTTKSPPISDADVDWESPWQVAQVPTLQLRRQAVISSLKASMDALADRPQSEISSWMQMWVPRMGVADLWNANLEAPQESLATLALPAEVNNYLLETRDLSQVESADEDLLPSLLRHPNLSISQTLLAEGQPVRGLRVVGSHPWSYPTSRGAFYFGLGILFLFALLRFLSGRTFLQGGLRIPVALPMFLMGIIVLPVAPTGSLLIVACALSISLYYYWLEQSSLHPGV